MYLDDLIKKLQKLREEQGNIKTIIPGDHQEYNKVDGVGFTYVEKDELKGYSFETVHTDDIEYYDVTKVAIIH